MPDMPPSSSGDPHNSGRVTDPSAALVVGGRVSVRYRLPEGASAGATDALGTLVERDEEHLTIETRRGPVRVTRADVIAAKDVPPAPRRRLPPHRRISVDDLERLMEQAWPAVERHELGSWVLRSSSGFTGRASSVLPVGDPLLPLDQAIDQVESWYAARAQTACFQVYGEPGFRAEEGDLGAALLRRGYTPGGGRVDWERVLVMTAPSAAIPPLTPDSVPVVADARMSPDWLLAYGEQRRVVPGATEAVLTGRERLQFLSVRDAPTGRIVGIARLALDPGWAGVFAVWVHPDHRRRGIATALTSVMAMLAQQHGMASVYLQVSGDNANAIALYEGLGFTVHHEYTYLVAGT